MLLQVAKLLYEALDRSDTEGSRIDVSAINRRFTPWVRAQESSLISLPPSIDFS